jgi:hypothetical protein
MTPVYLLTREQRLQQARSKPRPVFAFVRHESRARIEVTALYTATRLVIRKGLRRRGGGGGATAANC